MIEKDFDVIVVGGGHAGCEAALAAAQRNCKTLLLTTSLDTIGYLSSGGAMGKNVPVELIDEIDRLGGALKRRASECVIHKSFSEKGAPFYLLDKRAFRLKLKHALEHQENLSVFQTIVTDVLIQSGKVCGVATKFGQKIRARCVILCVGTFLRGKTSLGGNFVDAGRYGEIALKELAENLEKNGFLLNRNQIFIGPRLDKDSLNTSLLEVKKNDKKTPPLFPEKSEQIAELEIYLTRNGAQDSLCLEPEGIKNLEVYVEDCATITDEQEQESFLRSPKGLETAKITRFGYAVEYDYIIPDQLEATLETKKIKDLFTAGQINGTSGYEEAAAQGLIAGINAALKVKNEPPFILDRSLSYIGVLVDNLVTKNCTSNGV